MKTPSSTMTPFWSAQRVRSKRLAPILVTLFALLLAWLPPGLALAQSSGLSSGDSFRFKLEQGQTQLSGQATANSGNALDVRIEAVFGSGCYDGIATENGAFDNAWGQVCESLDKDGDAVLEGNFSPTTQAGVFSGTLKRTDTPFNRTFALQMEGGCFSALGLVGGGSKIAWRRLNSCSSSGSGGSGQSAATSQGGAPDTMSGTAPDTMIVFDGSGSMWGQIQGRTKIEIARDTLSSVLSETNSAMNIGMIAYGHRQKGVCQDIETVVPIGPASRTVPAMINAANAIQPKGKTPLTDAVRMAADELRFTENAATVVLVTDGIETCDADPCALGRELEQAGINFTAHVVGFGLSADEGRQVQCLADNTGGLYLSANNADELRDALKRTVEAPIAPDPSDFEDDAPKPREVRFILRDAEGGEQIGIRQLEGVVTHADGSPIEEGAFEFAYPEMHGHSAIATLTPGKYLARIRRNYKDKTGYKANWEFEVLEGDGLQVIEAVLGGQLNINVFINPNLPYKKGDPLPNTTGGSGPRIWFMVYPVEDGKKVEEPIARATMDNLSLPLGAGWYLVQGNLDRTTSAEKLVEVKSGEPTALDFSFDATRVYIEAVEADGFPVKRQTTYWYSTVPKGRNHWISGGGVSKGEVMPFYVPTGTWVVNVGGEGYGDRRSKILVEVPGDYQDIRLKVGEGETLTPDQEAYLASPEYKGCLELLKVERTGCIVKREDLSVTLADAGSRTNQQANMQTGNSQVGGGQMNTGTGTASATPSGATVGDAIVFNIRGTDRRAVTFQTGSDGKPLMVLEPKWCNHSGCEGETLAIPPDVFEAVKAGRTETFELGQYTVFTAPGQWADMLTVNSGSNRNVMTLSDDKTPAQTGNNQKAEAPSQPQGQAGKRYFYGRLPNGKPAAMIDFPPEANGKARIILSDGWCGDASKCGGSIAGLPAEVGVAIENGETAMFKDSWDAATITINPSLQTGTIEVIEHQTKQVARLEQFQEEAKADELPKNGGSVSPSPFPVGVFIQIEGGSIEDASQDSMNAMACMTSANVYYPDRTILLKRFDRAKASPDANNPFDEQGHGICSADGSRISCSMTMGPMGNPQGPSKDIAYTAKEAGNGHYELCLEGGSCIWLINCFTSAINMDPDKVMPNNRTLGEMLIERSDGKAAGFGFGEGNRTVMK